MGEASLVPRLSVDHGSDTHWGCLGLGTRLGNNLPLGAPTYKHQVSMQGMPPHYFRLCELTDLGSSSSEVLLFLRGTRVVATVSIPPNFCTATGGSQACTAIEGWGGGGGGENIGGEVRRRAANIPAQVMWVPGLLYWRGV